MKILRKIALFFLFCMVLPIYSQENVITSQLIPEQEAIKQTEKLQQELNLTTEQTKQIYEINLRYARERQVSNTRTEAMERIKNKNAELQQILNGDQNNRLQNKRYEHTTFESSSINRNQSINSSNFRSSTEYRINPSVRVVSIDINPRNRSHAINLQTRTNGQAIQAPQAARGNTPTTTRTTQINIPIATSRSQSLAPSSTKKQETTSNSPRR